MSDDERLKDIHRRQALMRELIDRSRQLAEQSRVEELHPPLMETMYYDINWLLNRIDKLTKGDS